MLFRFFVFGLLLFVLALIHFIGFALDEFIGELLTGLLKITFFHLIFHVRNRRLLL